MNRLTMFLLGSAKVRILSADPERCLNKLAAAGISFQSEPRCDAFKVTIRVRYCDLAAAVRAARQTQGETEILEIQKGIYGVPEWLHRPVLLIGLAMALFAVLILPKYVWVVTVTGNEKLDTSVILRAAEEFGVRFGARNSELDSVVIKNQLLERLDGLQWAAVNCSGGLCEIQVREREKEPEISDHRLVTDVVAGKTGVLTDVRILKGTGLCSPGQAVLKGDLLVSGVIDPAVHLRTAHAQAEIYAVTGYEKTAVIPLLYTTHTAETDTHLNRFIQFGRFRIKLSGNSRICTAGCVKMINRKSMTLPGGYLLPVTWITETCIHCDLMEQEMACKEAEYLLTSFLEEQISEEMVAGAILSSRITVQSGQGVSEVTGLFACREMIAREQEVNLFGSEQPYGRTNSERRTN